MDNSRASAYLRNLEANPVRLLMEILLPGSTPSSSVVVKPGRARHASGSCKSGRSQGLARIQHEKSDLPHGETTQ